MSTEYAPIPFVDLKRQYESIHKEIDDAMWWASALNLAEKRGAAEL